ncbi:MAG: nucleoside hydrolase [Pseudomonadota bacterium]
MTREKIIIDTDPGQDDAIAILLALASDALDVLGIVSVAGNVPLDLTTKNALKIVELSGRLDTPVYVGCEQPLLRDLITAEYVHGKTGLDGPDLPEPTLPTQPQHGVDFILQTLAENEPNTITLCTLGPLTNIAVALTKAPEIVRRAKRIVMMGGGFFEGGNVTPAAEFNIYVDPHAAEAVFRSGIPITMVPLDCTHKALTTQKRIDAFRAVNTPVCDSAASLIDFFERYDEDKYGTDGGPLHDPCVIAWLLDPSLFSGRECNVQVETQSELTMGMTVIDWWQTTGKPRNALVLNDVDAGGFFTMLTKRLAQL